MAKAAAPFTAEKNPQARWEKSMTCYVPTPNVTHPRNAGVGRSYKMCIIPRDLGFLMSTKWGPRFVPKPGSSSSGLEGSISSFHFVQVLESFCSPEHAVLLS